MASEAFLAKQRLGAEATPATGERVGELTHGSVPRVPETEGGEDVGHVIGSELDAAKKIAQLPTSMQAKSNDLPKNAQRALIK